MSLYNHIKLFFLNLVGIKPNESNELKARQAMEIGKKAVKCVKNRFRTIATKDDLIRDLQEMAAPPYLMSVAISDFDSLCKARAWNGRKIAQRRLKVNHG